MRLSAIILLVCLVASSGNAWGKAPYKSRAFDWDKTAVEVKSFGESRQFEKCTTNNVDFLEIHATTLLPGKKAPNRDTQSKFEKLLIVKDGKVMKSLNGVSKELNAGSVALIMEGDKVTIENSGEVPAVYYMIEWENPTCKKANLLTAKQNSEVILWNDAPITKTEKGASRKFLRRPTDHLFEFEMHVTTLNEGLKSHDPHVHPDDEIILIKSGTVEESIDGVPSKLGPGSFVLLNGGVPHGLKNIGSGACEYFAFRYVKNAPAK